MLNRSITRFSNAIPLYIQIAEGLLQQIENGELAPGDKLPSERKLSSFLGVNRMTLRQALLTLEQQGLIVRRQGDGTYVSEQKVEQQVGQWLPLNVAQPAPGYKSSAKLLTVTTSLATADAAKALQLPLSSSVYQISRLRLLNGKPITLENLTIPMQLFPKIDSFDLSRRLVYDIMHTEYQITVHRVRQSLEPVLATPFAANLLEVEVGAPLLLEERLAFDSTGTPIELGKDLYRGDRTRFVTESLMTFSE